MLGYPRLWAKVVVYCMIYRQEERVYVAYVALVGQICAWVWGIYFGFSEREISLVLGRDCWLACFALDLIIPRRIFIIFLSLATFCVYLRRIRAVPVFKHTVNSRIKKGSGTGRRVFYICTYKNGSDQVPLSYVANFLILRVFF